MHLCSSFLHSLNHLLGKECIALVSMQVLGYPCLMVLPSFLSLVRTRSTVGLNTTWCNSIIRLLISYPLSFPDPTSGDVKHDHIQQRHCAVYNNTTESVLLLAVYFYVLWGDRGLDPNFFNFLPFLLLT